MPTPPPRFRNRRIKEVAKRLGLTTYEMRCAIGHGHVKSFTWAGMECISPAEERRLAEFIKSNQTEEPPLIDELMAAVDANKRNA